MPSLSAYRLTWVSLTLDVEYLFTAAPAKRSLCSLPWMWSRSSWPLLCHRSRCSTHLEPDILECEVKSPLGRITTNKASGGEGIPIELFQILKDHAVKVLHSICQQIWKTQQWPQDWKRSVFIPIPKKGNAKNAQTTAHLHSSHMLVK